MAGIDFGRWVLRVISWDTVLPMVVVLLPFAIELVLPNNHGAIEIAAVLAPVTAFFLRYRAGKRQIALNQCSAAVRKVQFFVFCCGIMPLALLDCVVILSHLAPKGARFDKIALVIFCVLIAIYLPCMVVAMYPGRAKRDVMTE